MHIYTCFIRITYCIYILIIIPLIFYRLCRYEQKFRINFATKLETKFGEKKTKEIY